ncbi:MAG TPA: HAMP domain-containing sensor histidine kinase [Gemmatimonadaceae bacterium]|nr:HAMP domain-containing sensor histidine kinase [Gemmatimonadaceae bacterium]
MRRLGFRARLFIILLLFAALPSVVLTLAWSATASYVLPLLSTGAAWDRVGDTGLRALAVARGEALDPEERAVLDAHERELTTSLVQARRFEYLVQRSMPIVLLGAVIVLGLVVLGASRMAGHLSRQLSRPLGELVGWTDLIGRGEALPDQEPVRGAPEFATLRQRMRLMARELAQGRARALEAERLRAFQSTAREVAHELKNPLTPIRFAVERLKREAPPALMETVEVLAVESERIERMARSFAQFGRLLEGPAADVDVAELASYTARATVPPEIPLRLEVDGTVPLVRGHHDALQRALSNVLLNAVEACQTRGPGAAITVRVRPLVVADAEGVEVTVEDSGNGIPRDRLSSIWDPYVTTKSTGTGLGLGIVRQIADAHDGSVSAESEEGGGTRISIRLPAGATLAFTGEWHA